MTEKNESKHQQVLMVSAKDLSLMLGISTRQVWRLRAAGQLPNPVFLGGSVKWKCSDVELFLECGCDMNEFNAQKGGQK